MFHFDPNDPKIRKEIIGMIAEYLQNEEFPTSATVLLEEAKFRIENESESFEDSNILGNRSSPPTTNVGLQSSFSVDLESPNLKLSKSSLEPSHETENQLWKENLFRKMRQLILEGNWKEVENMCSNYTFKNHKGFLYALYKHHYLELLEKQEYQKAFSYLSKRLKPLESRQTNPEEFRDLCYLLTCKSIQDASSFKNWDTDKIIAREKLADQLRINLGLKTKSPTVPICPHIRLLELLRQSIAFQINQHQPFNPKIIPKIKTLYEDYNGYVLPNCLKNTFVGHKDNVKCVDFVGVEGNYLVSGSSDNTLKLWSNETGKLVASEVGHDSRLWDVCSTRDGSLVASASGDSTVKLWSIISENSSADYYELAGKRTGGSATEPSTVNIICRATLRAHQGDVYTVRFHPGQQHLISGGYDKTVRLFDVCTGALKRTFVGHNSSVSRAIFNPSGNLVITGSKDSTIRFWDISSGLCIRTISSHLGEVTSMEINSDGSLLLSGSKDNSNRLWETATARPITRFKGHQNTAKNFVRCGFGPDESFVIGGSEDGCIYAWDIDTGSLLQKLVGHTGVVYNCVWNQSQSLLVSCSHDGLLKTWFYDKATESYDHAD